MLQKQRKRNNQNEKEKIYILNETKNNMQSVKLQ